MRNKRSVDVDAIVTFNMLENGIVRAQMGAKKRKPAYVVTAPEELAAVASSKRESSRKQPNRMTIAGVIWLTAMLVVSPWLFGSVAPLFVFGLLTGFAVLLTIWWYCVVLQGERAIRLPWNLLPLLLGSDSRSSNSFRCPRVC